MTLFVVSLLLTVSFVINVIGFLYVRELVQSFTFLGETFSEYNSKLADYREHCQRVLEMEVYLEEPTIKSLLLHTEDIAKDTQEYQNGFSLDE